MLLASGANDYQLRSIAAAEADALADAVADAAAFALAEPEAEARADHGGGGGGHFSSDVYYKPVSHSSSSYDGGSSYSSSSSAIGSSYEPEPSYGHRPARQAQYQQDGYTDIQVSEVKKSRNIASSHRCPFFLIRLSCCT